MIYLPKSTNKFEQALSEFKRQCQVHKPLKKLRIVEVRVLTPSKTDR